MDNNKEIKYIFVRNYQIGTRNTSRRKLCINTTLVKKNKSEYKKCPWHRLFARVLWDRQALALLDYRGDPNDHQRGDRWNCF